MLSSPASATFPPGKPCKKEQAREVAISSLPTQAAVKRVSVEGSEQEPFNVLSVKHTGEGGDTH